MDLTLSFYHKTASRRIRRIYLFNRKYLKVHNLFSSNRKKVTKIDKKGKEITKTICYRLQFIDSTRFMESSL